MSKSASVDSIVAIETFIQATRDSGYRGTPSAISELVDNSLQAGARRVEVWIERSDHGGPYPLTVSILDDGCGMDSARLSQAMRFGGSSRFNDRSGLGRYGMGLPNSSLSQARRVEVYTWRSVGEVLKTHLDVDEIARGEVSVVPPPRRAELPARFAERSLSSSGTLVIWSECDRLDYKRPTTIARKLEGVLGRVFRHYLFKGVDLLINGDTVQPVDPLFLSEDAVFSGAVQFGETIVYEVQAPPSSPDPSQVGLVEVTFSELPIHEWHGLSNKEKRRRGVSKGAGVSVVRGDREVDYGWLFMGGKRKENYDDWWRCEVKFEPSLDEAFGITHTKQQIRPMAYLRQMLGQDLEAIARSLNGRARAAHQALKTRRRYSVSEERANELEVKLNPLALQPDESDQSIAMLLESRHPSLKEKGEEGSKIAYRIVEDSLDEMSKHTFFSTAIAEDCVTLIINPDHPFYRKVYKPLLEERSSSASNLRAQLELVLLAAARSEAAATAEEREVLRAHRAAWSRAIATFLNG